MNERCFAHRRNGKCVALTGEQCAGYAVCSFYKPIWKHAQDVARINQQFEPAADVKSSGTLQKSTITAQMPWKGENE